MSEPLSIAQGVSLRALSGGPFVAGAAIAAGSMVQFDTNGKVVVVPTTGARFPIGIVYQDFSTGDYVAVYELEDTVRLIAGATVAVGDIVKPSTATAGTADPDGTSGSTTKSADAVAVALEAATATNYFRAQAA